MDTVFFGERKARYCLIQPIDAKGGMDTVKEYGLIKERYSEDPVAFVPFEVGDWNHDLSPWKAPPAFGDKEFGYGALHTLTYIRRELLPRIKEVYGLEHSAFVLGGYSLAGLFSLWSAYRTDIFSAVCAASPSVWFPDWMEYVRGNENRANIVYLSMGEAEGRSKNKAFSALAENMNEQYALISGKKRLEHNPGNHFDDPELRMAKGFVWCLEALADNKLL